MIHDPDRLQQALGKATLARLIQGIAARLRVSGMWGSLAVGVRAIAGPLEDQRRARDSSSHRWTDLFSSIEAAMAALPLYRDWLARIRSTGLLKKYSGDDCVFAGMLLRQ